MSVAEHHSALSDLLKPNGSRGSRVAASEAAKGIPADDSASYKVELYSRHQKEGSLSAFAVKLWAGVSFVGALEVRHTFSVLDTSFLTPDFSTPPAVSRLHMQVKVHKLM